jgi:hypothetical protein
MSRLQIFAYAGLSSLLALGAACGGDIIGAPASDSQYDDGDDPGQGGTPVIASHDGSTDALHRPDVIVTPDAGSDAAKDSGTVAETGAADTAPDTSAHDGGADTSANDAAADTSTPDASDAASD